MHDVVGWDIAVGDRVVIAEMHGYTNRLVPAKITKVTAKRARVEIAPDVDPHNYLGKRRVPRIKYVPSHQIARAI